MGGVVRAIVSPLSIIDRDLGRLSLQIVAIGAAFIPGGQPIAAAAALALAVLYKPKGPKPEQQERSIKTPMPPRVSAYGRVRLFGAYILYVTNEDGYAVDVWAFHDGQLDFIERIYLGDKQVKLNGGGFVIAQNDGEFGDGDTIKIGTRLGLPTETAFAEVIARLPGIWTSSHRGDGVATGCMISKPVKAKNYNDVYPTGGPDANAMSIVARAQRVFDWRDPAQDINDPATWKWSDNAALAIAHYYLIRNNKDWDTHFAPTLAYWTAFADDCDVPMEVYHGAGVFVDDADSSDTSFELTSVEGLTPGKTVTLAAYAIDKVVASVSGNTVTLTTSLGNDYKAGTVLRWIGGGTEPRYRVALAHKHTDAHKVTLGNLLAACDGMVTTRADGALVPWSGRYVEPDPDGLIGPGEIVTWSMDDGIVDEDQANVVALTYLSSDHNFTTVPTSDWRDEDSIDEVGEKPTSLENSVPSHAQAARLAKRLLDKTMAPKRGTIATNPKGRKIRGKRFIPLHIEEAGTVFYSGPAEIMRIKRTQTGVQFDWVRANPNIDAWNAATEEGEPAPVGARPAVVPLETPVITDAEAELGEGGVGARIRITVAGFDRDDVTWHARWRVTTDVSWVDQEYTDIDPGPSAVLLTNLVQTDVSIDVAVAYAVGDGRRSEWSAIESVSTSTAALAPSPPTDVSGTGGVGEASVSWRNPTSGNLAYLRVYRGTTTSFGDASLISGDIVGGLGEVMSLDDAGLTAGTYYFWIRAFNAGGIGSAPSGPADASVT
ncbi:hypothetical protein [Sphingobium yanoikuyae]|uniref:hypothetical protein n=1 Tax=Sphingobium yanoikuyae TaxID=13690 RepID=UPI003F0BCF2B